MIERIVMIKLKPEQADAHARRAVVEHSREVLAGVPQVHQVWVGEPADARTEGAWDLCIHLHLADLDAVAAYVDDPTHRAYVDDYLMPKLASLKAWNFTA